jgi:enhancer of polycomb-like protein
LPTHESVLGNREPGPLMANKLAFRARAPDASKPLPIYHVDEIPDLVDAAINRAVPPMPTGMEKNEECVSRPESIC